MKFALCQGLAIGLLAFGLAACGHVGRAYGPAAFGASVSIGGWMNSDWLAGKIPFIKLGPLPPSQPPAQ